MDFLTGMAYWGIILLAVINAIIVSQMKVVIHGEEEGDDEKGGSMQCGLIRNSTELRLPAPQGVVYTCIVFYLKGEQSYGILSETLGHISHHDCLYRVLPGDRPVV